MPDSDVPDYEELEERMYGMLDDALSRAECAARAVARIEFGLVQKHMEQREPPTSSEDEGDEEAMEATQNVAEEASREFNSSHFQSTFFNLNVLKVVNDLMEMLDLSHLEEEVMHTLIREMFVPRGSSAPSRKGEGEAFVGSDADLLFHRLRQIAERKQRNYR